MNDAHFVWNHDKSEIININQILKISMTAPEFKQKDYQLVASLTYGTSVLVKGTEEECRAEMKRIYERFRK